MKSGDNLLTHLPEPDFSMPFNILSFTMVAFGFYLINVYFLTVERNNRNHWVYGVTEKKNKI